MNKRPRPLTRYSVHALIRNEAEELSLLVTLAKDVPYAGRYDLPGCIPGAGETVAEAIVHVVRKNTDSQLTDITRIGLMSSLFSFTMEDGTPQILHHLAALYALTLKGALSLENCLWLPVDQVTQDNSTPPLLWAAEWLKNQPAVANSEKSSAA